MSDEKSSQSDNEFAMQATRTMLDGVAATASTTFELEAEEDFEPYEITIRFNTEPSAHAKSELAECIYKIKSKYRLDFEVSTSTHMRCDCPRGSSVSTAFSLMKVPYVYQYC